MVRSWGIGVLAGVIACAGFHSASGQTAPPTQPVERIITVQEKNKPVQKCRVLKCWKEKDGSRVCQVQAVDSGELMTIVEPATPSTSGAQPKPGQQVFRWNDKTGPPVGAPNAPPGAVVVAEPELKPGFLKRMFSSKPAPVKKAGPAPASNWGKVERWSSEDSAKAVVTSETIVSQARPRPPVAVKHADDPLMRTEPSFKGPVSAVATGPSEKSVRVAFDAKTLATSPPSIEPTWVGPVTEAKPMGIGSARVSVESGSVTTKMKTSEEPAPSFLARLRGGSAKKVDQGASERREANSPGSIAAARLAAREKEKTSPMMVMLPDGRTMVVPADRVPPGVQAVPVDEPNAFSQNVSMGGFGGPMMGMPPSAMGGMGYPMPMAGAMPTYPMPMQAMVSPPPPTVVEVSLSEHTEKVRSLVALRDSILPSERESAADALSQLDWKAEPMVVQALAHAAQHDPAPMVRVSCIRGLARMRVNTLPVARAVGECRQDKDARVRLAAEEVFAEMMRP